MKLFRSVKRKVNNKYLLTQFKLFCSSKPSSNTDFEDSKSIEDFIFNKGILDLKVPAFKFYSSQIQILREPSEFYLSLIVMNN